MLQHHASGGRDLGRGLGLDAELLAVAHALEFAAHVSLDLDHELLLLPELLLFAQHPGKGLELARRRLGLLVLLYGDSGSELGCDDGGLARVKVLDGLGELLEHHVPEEQARLPELVRRLGEGLLADHEGSGPALLFSCRIRRLRRGAAEENLVLLVEVRVRDASGKALTSDPYDLKHAAVAQLVYDELVAEAPGRLHRVRLDALDVVRGGGAQGLG
mmetsp:Transcript_7381/g.14588  ORF Transcript_7381/g.14588 Transcript_7381/m.14588 type:complete len:217 (-) Transcript_7381:1116-1766(-)